MCNMWVEAQKISESPYLTHPPASAAPGLSVVTSVLQTPASPYSPNPHTSRWILLLISPTCPDPNKWRGLARQHRYRWFSSSESDPSLSLTRVGAPYCTANSFGTYATVHKTERRKKIGYIVTPLTALEQRLLVMRREDEHRTYRKASLHWRLSLFEDQEEVHSHYSMLEDGNLAQRYALLKNLTKV